MPEGQGGRGFRGGLRRGSRRAGGSAIEQVLADREYMMVFQPLVDLKSGEVFAYEALLRSKSPKFSNPLEMIDAAVAAKRISELGRGVREMAVATCDKSPLFVNIHPQELDQGLLVRPDDPIFFHEHDVHLEITESVPLSHSDLCHSVLAEIRSKGIKLAIDDLGAGFSNLKYIADLSPEVVKIDRELVRETSQAPRCCKLVKHIVNLCADMGAKVVAEGIETTDELHAVQDTGADYGQGYLFARPGFPPPAVVWPGHDPGVTSPCS